MLADTGYRLKDLALHHNQIGDEGMKAFSKAIGSGALGNLKELHLHVNRIGDVGMAAFAEALKPTDRSPMGALAELTYLNLAANQVGDEGMKALSTAIASGSLPKLASVFFGGNPGNDMGAEEACSARGIEYTT